MASKQQPNSRVSTPIIAAIIAGVFGLTGSLIGLATVYKENSRLKMDIQRLTMKLDAQSRDMAAAQKQLAEKEAQLTTAARVAEEKSASLQGVIAELNKSTLVTRYNSDSGWSGFETLPGKGEHALQCAVDRFFVLWNEQVPFMTAAGCEGVVKKVIGVHHAECCN